MLTLFCYGGRLRGRVFMAQFSIFDVIPCFFELRLFSADSEMAAFSRQPGFA